MEFCFNLSQKKSSQEKEDQQGLQLHHLYLYANFIG
jgi:hypothetical protein